MELALLENSVDPFNSVFGVKRGISANQTNQLPLQERLWLPGSYSSENTINISSYHPSIAAGAHLFDDVISALENGADITESNPFWEEDYPQAGEAMQAVIENILEQISRPIHNALEEFKIITRIRMSPVQQTVDQEMRMSTYALTHKALREGSLATYIGNKGQTTSARLTQLIARRLARFSTLVCPSFGIPEHDFSEAQWCHLLAQGVREAEDQRGRQTIIESVREEYAHRASNFLFWYPAKPPVAKS